MSTIPKVKYSSIDSVRQGYDREGLPYIENMMNEVAKKQPILASQICILLKHLDEKMDEGEIDIELKSYVIENIGYRMFATIKSLYIQEEVDELEKQSKFIIGVINEEK